MIEIGSKVVVTTEFRGVFFGELTAFDPALRRATLSGGRNCLYWEKSARGFIGLATDGPNTGSRVGPAADSLDLLGVTSVMACSDLAAEKWEAGPWV